MWYVPMPPGKNGEPVIAVITSAAARLKVLCPEINPGKAGVTKFFRWYGSHSVGRIHFTPLTWVFGSNGCPGQARMARRLTERPS